MLHQCLLFCPSALTAEKGNDGKEIEDDGQSKGGAGDGEIGEGKFDEGKGDRETMFSSSTFLGNKIP